MIVDSPWYLVLLCLLLGAAYAAILYFVGRQPFSRGLRWGLAALRFVAVSAVALLLLAPATRQTRHERQLPHVVLVQDVSGSVASGPDSAFSFERAGLAGALQGHCRVSRISFGDRGSTDIGAALDSCRGGDVAAVVLASDGIHNRGANPVGVARRLAVPVHCIALGDTTPQRDALLTGLRHNRIAMLGGTIPVEVTLRAILLDGQASKLAVTAADGRVLHSEPVRYGGADFAATLSLELPAQAPGLQCFTLTLAPAEGEVSLENNRLAFYVDVIDNRRHIALVANAPHPDLAALKQSLEASPAYRVDIVLAEEAERGRWRADSGDYSLAILHNLPSQRHPSVEWVADLPQVYVIGLQTDLPRFNALHTGLEIVARASRTNEVTALHNPSFSLFSLAADDVAALEELPPLSAPFGEARLSEAVQTLFSARLGNLDSRLPLVAATAQGERRKAFVWGEGLWRWRLADYRAHRSHDHVDRLLAQLVGFTSLAAGRERLQVEAERTYAAGLPVALRAQLYNEAYQLTNAPEVTLHLEGDSVEADHTFRRAGEAYALVLPALAAGVYRYRATSDNGLEATGSFAVEALDLEQQRMVADHSLLATVAALTGGNLYAPDEAGDLAAQLRQLKPTLHTRTRYREVMHLPLALALILLLLTAEWVLRKYHGSL